MPFHMLMHELVPRPKDDAKEKMLSGCEVFFPDTVFFHQGQAKYIVLNDRDFCLAKYESEDKKPI